MKTETQQQDNVIRKTMEKLTFAQFCAELQGYRFFSDSDLENEIFKFELFHFKNLRLASDAFSKYFSIKIK